MFNFIYLLFTFLSLSSMENSFKTKIYAQTQEDLAQTVLLLDGAKAVNSDNPEKYYEFLEKLIQKKREKYAKMIDILKEIIKQQNLSEDEAKKAQELYDQSTTEELFSSTIESVSKKIVKEKKKVKDLNIYADIFKQMEEKLEQENNEKVRIAVHSALTATLNTLKEEIISIDQAMSELINKQPKAILPEVKIALGQNKQDDANLEHSQSSSSEEKKDPAAQSGFGCELL